MPMTSFLQQASHRWRAIPRVWKWTLIVSVVVGAATTWQWQLHRQNNLIPLFEGCELTETEVQRIRLALGKAKLNDYHVRAHQLLVPQHRWAVYSQALLDQDAFPERLIAAPPQPPPVNVLATRRQQEQLELHQRKQNLRDLIIRLPFVESAMVDLDVMEPTGPYQARQFTCIISVKPRAGQILHDDEVESIRRIVLGAVAGAAPERIYVADLNCGITHDPTWNSSSSAEPARWRQLQAKHELQEKIQSELASYGRIEISVRVDPVSFTHERPLQPPHYSDAGNATAGDINPPAHHRPRSANMPIVGSNSQASVKDQLSSRVTPDRDRSSEVPSMGVNYSPTMHATPPFSVSLAIPESTLKAYWESCRARQGVGSIPWSKEESRLAFDQLRMELVQKIRPLLPPGQRRTPEQSLEISMIAEPAENPSRMNWLSAALGRLGWRSMGAGLAIGSSLLLAAFLYLTTAHRSRRKSNTPGGDGTETTEANPRLDELRQQIDQLIQNDPDTAARVIQQWIRHSR